jgi:hypothetical protein
MTQNSAKPTVGVCELTPKEKTTGSLKSVVQLRGKFHTKEKTSGVFFFQKKKQKTFVQLRGRRFGDPKLGEADPGGLGACPQGQY